MTWPTRYTFLYASITFLIHAMRQVYFVGIIDVLQKYNMVKWMERELKRQRTQLFRRESVSDKVREYPSPVSTLPSSPMEPAGTLPALPPLAPSTKHSQKRHSVQSHASTMSFISDLGPSGTSQYGEPSVEEPKRYGTRLLGFIQSVLA